jgi:hypothetical protein
MANLGHPSEYNAAVSALGLMCDAADCDSEAFVEAYFKVIEGIDYIGKPISWDQVQPDAGAKELCVVLSGAVGAGKSTSINHIAGSYACHPAFLGMGPSGDATLKAAGVYRKKGGGMDSVTKECGFIDWRGLYLIDTPGTNDADKKMSNATVQCDIAKAMAPRLNTRRGLGGSIHVVNLKGGGRLSLGHIEGLVHMLDSLTTFYPGADGQWSLSPNHPKMRVLITGR